MCTTMQLLTCFQKEHHVASICFYILGYNWSDNNPYKVIILYFGFLCGHGCSIPKPSPSHTCSAEQQGGTGLSGVLVLAEPSLVESFHKVSLTGLLSRGLQMGQNISTVCFANTSYVKCSFFTRNICTVYMYHLTGNSCPIILQLLQNWLCTTSQSLNFLQKQRNPSLTL